MTIQKIIWLTAVIALAVTPLAAWVPVLAQDVPVLDVVHQEQLNPRSGFPRYRIGSECAYALAWTENQFWRDKRPDTTYYARGGNPSQRIAVEAVNQCVARFNMLSTAQRDLLGLGKAYLAGEQNDQADATLKKLASSFSADQPSAQAWALYQIVDVYLGAAQPQLGKADGYVTQLDALGAKAPVERMLAHKRFADAAAFRDSIPLREREINAALTASKEITGDDRKEYAPASMEVYFGLADLYARQGDAAKAMATVDAARGILVPLRPSLGRFFDAQVRWYQPIGQPAPTIEATQWFNTGTAGNTRPVTGKTNLIVFVSHSCGGRCYPGYAVLRRLAAKFPNVEITLVARAQGYYRNQLMKPDSEFVKARDYFVNTLKLPGALALWKTDFGKRYDGHLTVEPLPNEEAYKPPTLLTAYIVDRKGVVRFVGVLSRDNEAILEDEIASLQSADVAQF